MSEQSGQKREEADKDPIEERLSPTRSTDDGEREPRPTAPGEATTTGTPPSNR